MSLANSLNIANSGLSASSQQSAVAARNVANASQPNASRKTVNLVSVPGAGVKVASITRAADQGLTQVLLSARSDVATQNAISSATTALAATIGDPQNDQSAGALIANLKSSLQTFSSSPQNAAIGRAAVSAAQDLANGLNSASNAVTAELRKADSGTADSVKSINDLLSTFQSVNDQIVQGTQTGQDITDLQDKRDGLLKSLSNEIGIRTFVRGSNDLVVQTDSGVTLFEKIARSVTFQATPNIVQGQSSNLVYVDGVPVTSQAGGMPVSSGAIAGFAKVSTTLVPTYGKQLDEIARGLVSTFAESDQSANPTLPTIPGLFTYPGAPAIPTSAAASVGLAGTIKVNPTVDPTQGGNPNLIRDGGVGAPGVAGYVANTSGGSGYSDRLLGLINGLDAARPFDPVTGLQGQASVAQFATDSASWVAAQNKAATSEASYKQIVVDRSTTALSNATGVNIDQEVTNMLDIERSYQASAKVLGVVNQMIDTLMSEIK